MRVDLPACSKDAVLCGVEHQVRTAKLGRDRGLSAARQRPDAGDQHREVEWLRQVIVRAETEPADQVIDGPGGSQHQHPTSTLAGDELGAELIAVHTRQVAVEHDHLVVIDERACESGGAIECDVHCHTRLPQSERDRLGHLLVVLDHEHPHLHQATSRWFQRGFTGGEVHLGADTFPKPLMPYKQPRAHLSSGKGKRHATPPQTQQRPQRRDR